MFRSRDSVRNRKAIFLVDQNVDAEKLSLVSKMTSMNYSDDIPTGYRWLPGEIDGKKALEVRFGEIDSKRFAIFYDYIATKIAD